MREFEQWRRAGFTKVRIDGKMHDLHDPILIQKQQHHDIDLLLDVLTTGNPDYEQRIREAIKLAGKHAEGWLRIASVAKNFEDRLFSKKLSSLTSGQSFPDLEPRLFSFNSPYGMCLKCKDIGYLEKGSGKKGGKELDDEDDIDELFSDALSNFEVCSTCHGTRLRPESLAVLFCEKNIFELTSMSTDDLAVFLRSQLPKLDKNPVALRVLDEVLARLGFLTNVGVGYLSLGRSSATLSGGEAQRIRLATQLGSHLSGVMYVLDEPSIGLHPADHRKLIHSLEKLRDNGNSVIVVEHDEETMLAADHLVDIGPGAGVHGGHVILSGTPKELMAHGKSSTIDYLSGRLSVTDQRARRTGNQKLLEITGATGNNLHSVDLAIPLSKMVVFTGVSGSGKSSLVRNTLEAALAKKLYRSQVEPLPFKELKGLEHIDKLVHVDQKPIGRTPRSNPATYTGLFSALRTVFAQTPDAQVRGYTAGTFSFNVKGGRCDACEGAGRIKMEMHFLADAYIPCETCNGTRYRREVLEVRFKGKSIAECLSMTIEEAHEHFQNQFLMEPKLKTLLDVGLGYIQLGQSSTTLSGGEAQRIKLAKELSKRSTGKTIYFLDEPTTGLHFQDVRKLLELLHRLVDLGNTVVIIEHNMDVICAADWLIDMGPGPGKDGGKLVFQGSPEDFAIEKKSASVTTKYIREFFARHKWK